MHFYCILQGASVRAYECDKAEVWVALILMQYCIQSILSQSSYSMKPLLNLISWGLYQTSIWNCGLVYEL